MVMGNRIDINLKTGLNTSEVSQQVKDITQPNAQALINTGIERDGGITNLYVKSETRLADTIDFTETGDKVETFKNGEVRDVYVNGKKVGVVSAYGVNSDEVKDVDDFLLTETGYLTLSLFGDTVTIEDQDGNTKLFDLSSITFLNTISNISFIRETDATLDNIEVIARSGEKIFRLKTPSDESNVARVFSADIVETTQYGSSLLVSTDDGIYEYKDNMWYKPDATGVRLSWSGIKYGIKSLGSYVFIYNADGVSSYDGTAWKYADGTGTGTGPYTSTGARLDVQPIMMTDGTFVFTTLSGIMSYKGGWKYPDGSGTGTGPYYAGFVNTIKDFGAGFVCGGENVFSYDGSNWKYADGTGTGTGVYSEDYIFKTADATRIIGVNKTTEDIAVYVTSWSDLAGCDFTYPDSAVISSGILVLAKDVRISSYSFTDSLWSNSDGTGGGTTLSFNTTVEANKNKINTDKLRLRLFDEYILTLGDVNYLNISLPSTTTYAVLFDSDLKVNYPKDAKYIIENGGYIIAVNKSGDVSSFDGTNWKYADGTGSGTGPYYNDTAASDIIGVVKYGDGFVIGRTNGISSFDGTAWKYANGTGSGTGPFGLAPSLTPGLSSFKKLISWNDGSSEVMTVIGQNNTIDGYMSSASWESGAWLAVDSADITAATYPKNTWDLIDVGPEPSQISAYYDIKSKIMTLAGSSTLSTQSVLKKTLQSPNAEATGLFGYSVSLDGSNVLIGAYYEDGGGVSNSGRAYLFNTSGTLLQTYNSPNPESDGYFGYSVSLDGSNVLIGAYYEDGGAKNSGRAYLFNTSGTLLQTYISPNAEATGLFGLFGSSVSLDGDNVLIGAYREDGGAIDSGRVYLFNTSGTLLQTYESPNPEASGYFGYSVSLDGDNVLIGATRENGGSAESGRAYLFNTSGTLLQTYNSPNPEASGYFGYSVSLDGDNVLIGAPFEDAQSLTASGRVYLFNTSGTLLQTYESPNPEASGYFGHSVSLDGDNVLIGALGKDSSGLSKAGSTYLFNTSGTLLRTYDSPNAEPNGYFGWSVSLDGDNVLIGAYKEDGGGVSGSGRAYVYSISETKLRNRLLDTLESPNPNSNGNFGYSVSLDGDKVLVGATRENGGSAESGRAYLFNTSGTLLRTYISPNLQAYSAFGWSVSLDGDNVLISAYQENGGGVSASGRVYLFNTSGTLLQTYISPNAESGGQFGSSVSLDGDNVLVGAYQENGGATDSGRVYLFNTSGTLLQTYNSPNAEASGEFGRSVSLDEDNVLIGAYKEDGAGISESGRAYLFNTSGTLLQTYESPNIKVIGYFGWSVSLDGDNVLIGAYREDGGSAESGRAYLFNTSGTLLRTYISPNLQAYSAFGWSVSLDGDNVLISAYQENGGGVSASGRVYLFNTSGTLLQTYDSPNPVTSGQFGYSVSLDGDKVLVGAFQEDGGATDSGRAYLYERKEFGQVVQGRTTTAYVNSNLQTVGSPISPIVGLSNTSVISATTNDNTTIIADETGISSFDGTNWKYADGSGSGTGPYLSGSYDVKYMYEDVMFTNNSVIKVGKGTQSIIDEFGIKTYNFIDDEKLWLTGSPYGIVYYYYDRDSVLTYEDLAILYISDFLPTDSPSGWTYCYKYENGEYIAGVQGAETKKFIALSEDFVKTQDLHTQWAYPQISAGLSRHVITVPGVGYDGSTKHQLGYHGYYDFTDFSDTVDWNDVTVTAYKNNKLAGYAYVETTYDTGGSEYYTSYYPEFDKSPVWNQITVTSNTDTRIGAYGKLTYEPETWEIRIGMIGDFQSYLSAAIVNGQENMGVLLSNVGEIDAQWTPQVVGNKVAYRWNGDFYVKEITDTPDNLISQIDFDLIKINTLHPLNILSTQDQKLSVGSSDFNGRAVYTSDESPGAATLVSSQLTGEYSTGIDVGSKISNIVNFDSGDIELIGIGLPFNETSAPIDVYFQNDYYFTVDNAGNEAVDATKSGTFYIEDNRLPLAINSDYGFKTASSGGTTVILEDGFDGYQLANSLETEYDFFELFGQLYAFDGKSIYLANLSNTNVLTGLTQTAVATGLEYIATTPSEVYFKSKFDNSLFTFTGGRILNKAVRLNRMGDVDYGVFNVMENTLWLKTDDEIITVRDGIASTINLPDEDIVRVYNTANGVIFKTENFVYNYAYAQLDDEYTISPLVWKSAYYGFMNSTKSVLFEWIIATISEDKKAEIKITTSSFLENKFVDDVQVIKLTASDFDENGFTTIRVQPKGAKSLGSSVKIESNDKIIISNVTAEISNIEKVNVSSQRSR
jgi:hypothetical protein